MVHRLALAATLIVAAASVHATSYTFEPRHTQGVLRWNHMGFSNPTAQFSQVEGSLEYDPAHPIEASVTATIPIAHLATGVPDLDEDFRGEKFFDPAHFPTATFKSTKVEPGAAGHLKVTGDLTVRGTTQRVTLDAVLNKIGINPRNRLESIGFDATATLKRSDFGLGLFVPFVSDEIRIELTVEANEAKAYAEMLRKEDEEDARAKQGGK